MKESLAPAVLTDSEELAALRQAVERYHWLRDARGAKIWYTGDALDVRVDVGLEHIALLKDVTPNRLTTRERRQRKKTRDYGHKEGSLTRNH